MVLISTGRSREVSCTSKALIERSLGSLFSHLGLQSRAEMRGIGGGASTSSLSIVLGSSIVNTVNLFTSDQGTLIAGHTERVQKGIAHWDKQNHAVPAPSCMLKVRGEIIKDEGL